MFELIINNSQLTFTTHQTLQNAIEAACDFANVDELSWTNINNHIYAENNENSFRISEAFRPEIFIVIVDNKYVSTHKSEKSAQDAVQDLSNYLKEGFQIEIRKSNLLG
jgi:hypothetical protein